MRLRHAFFIAALISLLLCVATCVLWAATWNRYTTLAHWVRGAGPASVGETHEIAFWQGGLRYHLTTSASNGQWPAWFGSPGVPALRNYPHWYGGSSYKCDGYFVAPFGSRGPILEVLARTIWVPTWLVAALTGLLPLIGVLPMIRSIQQRRRSVGYCQCCNYNLTGNVSGVCPECGDPCESEKRASCNFEPPQESNM